MFVLVDFKFIAIAMMAVCFLKSSDGKIHKTPPAVIYRLVGSKIVLTWCISPKEFDISPDVTFYLKNPSGLHITKRAIATVASGAIVILPSGSTITHLFSPNQLQVIVSNCTVDGESEHQLNYTLVITNLTVNQSRIYKFEADYIAEKYGDNSETKLIIIEPPSQPKITCTSGEVTSKNITVKEGDQLNCSCSETGGIPAPDVYWVFPGKETNSSRLLRDGILRNENGTYTCIALNRAGDNSAKLEVDVQYFELTCNVSLRDDGKVVIKTTAMGNPEVNCHPFECINEMIVTKDIINQTQFAYNSVDSGYCNGTVFFDKKSKCTYSSKEIDYIVVWDESKENNNTVLFPKKMSDMPDLNKLDLFTKDNELFWPNATKFVPERQTDEKIKKYFKRLCSGGSGILLAPTLISFVFLVFLLVINE